VAPIKGQLFALTLSGCGGLVSTTLTQFSAVLAFLLSVAAAAQTPPESPEWAARPVGGGQVRVAVPAPQDPSFSHLAWPKAIRAGDGTIILAYLAGKFHGGGGSPAVSRSSDDGKTFSPPQILRRFGPGMDYTNSGNLAIGTAKDGALVLLAMAQAGDRHNMIFGWRSVDAGVSWAPTDTSALGPDLTGSVTGNIIQVPGVGLMATGHYRAGSHPYTQGIWIARSTDDGRSWQPPQQVNAVDGGEPVLVRAAGRLLIFIRGRGTSHQYLAVSDDSGLTWRTSISSIAAEAPKGHGLAHPFAEPDPENPDAVIMLTAERPLPGRVWFWRGDARSLEWNRVQPILDFPQIPGDAHDDFGYTWMIPKADGRHWLVFYYHGLKMGANAIWVAEVQLPSAAPVH